MNHYNHHRERDYNAILSIIPIKSERKYMFRRIKPAIIFLIKNGIEVSIGLVDVLKGYKVPMSDIIKIMDELEKSIKNEYNFSHRLFEKSNKIEKNIILTLYAYQDREKMQTILFKYIMNDYKGSQKKYLFLELKLEMDKISGKQIAPASQMQPTFIDTEFSEPPNPPLLSTSIIIMILLNQIHKIRTLIMKTQIFLKHLMMNIIHHGMMILIFHLIYNILPHLQTWCELFIINLFF